MLLATVDDLLPELAGPRDGAGTVHAGLLEEWNELGRYGRVGGTGTSAYVHPGSDVVAILLTQVVLGSPGIEELLKAFSTFTAGVARG